MDAAVAELERRVAQLEARLAELAGGSAGVGARLVAPVEVVSAEGRRLATIGEERGEVCLRLYGAGGEAAASVGVEGTGAGFLALRDAEGQLLAYLNIELSGGRLLLEGQAGGGLALFGDGGGAQGGGLNVLHAAGGLSAALWSGEDGGELALYDGRPGERVTASLPPRAEG